VCKVTPNTPDSEELMSFTLFLFKKYTEMGEKMNQIHIGGLIHEELKTQRRSVAWLSKQIPCNRSHAYRILKKERLDYGLLEQISKILKTNFLKYYYGYFDDVEK
jgi:hypothetical protein